MIDGPGHIIVIPSIAPEFTLLIYIVFFYFMFVCFFVVLYSNRFYLLKHLFLTFRLGQEQIEDTKEATRRTVNTMTTVCQNDRFLKIEQHEHHWKLKENSGTPKE